MTPTTHIFKLPPGLVSARKADMRTSVENEWLCAQLLRAYGLPIAETAMGQFEDQKALIVTRFDRQRVVEGYWLRLPQEDFCQALGRPSEAKYESDGGPGHAEVIEKLLLSDNAETDLVTFFRSQLLFWMLAATDGHAKNFSLRLLPGGRYELTPLYDVLSAWPVTGQGANLLNYKELKLAMALHSTNRHYLLETVRTGIFWRLPRDVASVKPRADADRRNPGENGFGNRPGGQAAPANFPVDVFEAITKGLAGPRTGLP